MITVSKYGFPRKSEVLAKIARMIAKINLIYCFYFPQSGKMYFGQTEDFWHRMSGYRANLKCNNRFKDHQSKLFNALMKYDFNFTITIVAMNIDTDKLDDTETSYIAMFDSYKNGYNGTAGGKVLRGEDSPMWGKTHNSATRAQMSESRMGDPRPKSVEWCQEHSEKMKGDNNPKRIAAIQKYSEQGIDITTENILKVYQEENNNVAQTAQKIGCPEHTIKSVINRI
jgi:group I intron endonuclease